MTYQPKTTPQERKLMLQIQGELFPGPDVEVVRNVLTDLHTCEAALAERQEILRLYLMELAKALEQRHQWQPIETAPKDGTLLLGWWAEGMRGKGLPFILTWAKWLDDSEDGAMCWMDFTRAWPCEPTHWQPLPQPPERSVI